MNYLTGEVIRYKYYEYKNKYKNTHRLVYRNGEYIIETYNKRVKQFSTSEILPKQKEVGLLSFIGLGYKEYSDEVYAMLKYIEYCDTLEDKKENQIYRIV